MRSFVTSLVLLLSFVHTANSQAPVITVSSGIAIGSSSALNGVAYGNSKYVTAGASGKVYVSSDGSTWSPVTHVSIPTGTITGVAFGNGTFVVVGTAGEIATSSDGITWTARTSGISSISKAYFYNSLFYVLSYTAKVVLTSPDGITWTSLNFGNTDYCPMNMTYGNSIYAISARDVNGGNSFVFTSSTGLAGSWTRTTIDNSLGTAVNGIFYLKDRFFALHSATQVFTSTNGTTWINVTASTVVTHPNNSTSTLGSPNQVFNGIYDGTSIYLFGSSSYHGSYGVFVSTDGTNFTLQPKLVTLTTQGSAYINGRYFNFGNEGIVSATNGSNWTYPGAGFLSLASNGSNVVAVGSAATADGQMFSSSDFSTWTNRTTSYVNALNGVVYGGGKYVAVGNGGAVATSTDGLTWSIGSSGDADVLKSVAYGNSKYVAVGNQGKIMYSSDAVSWTQAKKDGSTGSNFLFVTYLNNRFIAVGGSATASTGTARVEYSPDGVTWTASSPNPTMIAQFHSIAYDGTRYLLVGRDNTSGSQKFFSRTTTDITNASGYAAAVTIPAANSGGIDLGTATFGGVVYSGGRFVAITNQKSTPFTAYVLESTDGTSWSAYSANTTARLRGIISSGNQFKIVGLSDTKLLSSFASLPLKLVNFTAVANAKSTLLKWNTEDEQNTKAIEIQSGTTGVQFSTIGSVAAHGSGTHAYSFTHDHANLNNSLYYRLKMIDLDGTYTYSPIRNVRLNVSEDITLQVFPNPASHTFQINMKKAITKAVLTIYDLNGQVVLQQDWQPGQEISVTHLPQGRYRVALHEGSKKYSTSFLKK